MKSSPSPTLSPTLPTLLNTPSARPIGPPIPTAPDTPDPPAVLFDFHLAHLSDAERAEFHQRLARLPLPLAQRVLDEYNSAVGRGLQFRNRWGWIEYLIRKAQRGEFIPTAELAERRLKLHAAATATPGVAAPVRQPSAVWQAHRATFQTLLPGPEYATYVRPLRGIETDDTLWLEAPNGYTVDWVRAHWALFEQVLQPHTPLALNLRLAPD